MGHGRLGGQLDDTKDHVASRHMEVRRCQRSATELSVSLTLAEELKDLFPHLNHISYYIGDHPCFVTLNSTACYLYTVSVLSPST